jgi:hypothetical protein
MDEEKNYWFPAKRPGDGWGWGFPATWQGWTVYLAFWALLVGGAVVLARQQHPVAIVPWAFFLSAIVIVICFWKGEPPGPFFGRIEGNPRQKPRIK